jgi:CBS domain containing-hemolysin-like protein
MSKVFWEIIFVFILTLLNGFFAMSEIALISVRKTRINALAKEGNKRHRKLFLPPRKLEFLLLRLSLLLSRVLI